MSRLTAILALACAAAAAGAPAEAQPDLLSRETLSGLIDLRVAFADGETAWIDGGFGKLRHGNETTFEVAEAHLVWRPRLSWEVGAVIDLSFQAGQDQALDVGEAFLAWRPTPISPTRITARAGLFYPPVSQEHHGGAWTVTETITPSAINSWIGEEVKVVGLEATIRRPLGDHELAFTGGVFGYNDTSGTLLSFRGWALHDLKATAVSDFPLPPLSPFMTPRQAPVSTPVHELDGRVGYYGRIDWTPPAPAGLSLFYYDNVGDRTSVEGGQWAWETRFLNLGGFYEPDARTRLTAQAMAGETIMGFRRAGEYWVDVEFASAFVMASRGVGPVMVSGRLDWFTVLDRSLVELDDNHEDGWAALAAVRWPLRDRVELLVEALHVDSQRPSRTYGALAPGQGQTQLQTALRLTF